MQQALDKLNSLINKCKNTATDQLKDYEIAIKAIEKFATNGFGLNNLKSSLDIDHIYDEVKCENCNSTVRVYGKDTPLFNSIYSNICNGITSLRRLMTSKSSSNILDNFGIDYKKDNHKLIFNGISCKLKRPTTPASVRKFFNSKEKLNCAECNVELNKKSFKGEWHIDHIHSDNMEMYLDKDYAKNPDNYQILCLSCSSTDREVEKITNE